MSSNGLFTVVGILLSGLLYSAIANAAADSPGKAITLDADPHLVAWLKFDETSGKVASDTSKQPHPATLEGGLSFDANSAPGRIGKAIQLDGKDQRIRITGFKGITGTQQRSVAAWVKTKSTSGEIVSWGFDDAGKMFKVEFIRARIGTTPKGGYLYMKAPVDDDAWHHIAVVVQEASPPNLHDDVKLYRDGEPAEIDDIGLLDLWPIDTGDQLDVTIGRRYKGLIDDLRIYDRALSGDEINALFKLDSSRPLAKP